MNVFYSPKLPIWTAMAGLVAAGALHAQAPPGPLPGGQPQQAPAAETKPLPPLPPPRETILGAWKLNRDESDDPRKRRHDSDNSNGGSGGGYGGRRGGMGGGYPGGGYPGGRGHGYGGESDEERQKMRELLTPASKITLSMTGAEVDLVDDQDRKRALMTDGRKLQKSKDRNYQEIAAKWDGHRLVTDEKDPGGNKMSRTFQLSEDGRQLYETLHLKMGRNNTETSIRYVYDIPPPTRQ